MNQKFKKSLIQYIGLGIIIIGIVILAITVFTPDNEQSLTNGGKASFGFFLIMLGMPFFFLIC